MAIYRMKLDPAALETAAKAANAKVIKVTVRYSDIYVETNAELDATEQVNLKAALQAARQSSRQIVKE